MPDVAINTGPIIGLTAALGDLKILLKGKRFGLVSDLENCIERMQAQGIWISRELRERALSE